MGKLIAVAFVGAIGAVGIVAAVLLSQDAEKQLQAAQDQQVVQESLTESHDDTEEIALRQVVQALEEKLSRFEARIQELESSAPAEDDADDILVAGLQTPSPELDELIAAAVARAKKGDVAAQGSKTNFSQKKNVEKLIAYIDTQIDQWAETYDLATSQVDDLGELTRRAIDRRVAADARGASKREITNLDVATQAEVRQIVGDQVYFSTERERLTRQARRTINWLTMAVGGLDEAQHMKLDGLVESTVGSKLSDVVRARSEPMSEENHTSVITQIKRVDTDAWAQIRDQVLTEEQRRRIPGK